jgi:D-alanyl-D-alanine carboxypeptidase
MNAPRLCLVLALAALAAPAPAVARSAPRYAPAYKGAIVVDAASGRVLFEDNADAVSPPASMTKLMTFAVLNDRIRAGALSLQARVTVVPADTRAAPSIIGLRVHETFPLSELVYAMMIHSANDAALAVARTAGGSVPEFVRLMNAKAAALGMRRTVFRTPNGLPPPSRRIVDGDLTTPRDFAILCRYLIENTDVLMYTSVRTRNFGSGIRFPPTPMTNHNHLLGRIAGVDGLKTGFTNGAGFCLAATARRGDRRIIVVMMDSPDSKSRDLRVAELIERGFVSRPVEIGVPSSPSRPAAPQARADPPGDPVIRFALPD